MRELTWPFALRRRRGSRACGVARGVALEDPPGSSTRQHCKMVAINETVWVGTRGPGWALASSVASDKLQTSLDLCFLIKNMGLIIVPAWKVVRKV